MFKVNSNKELDNTFLICLGICTTNTNIDRVRKIAVIKSEQGNERI